MALGPELEQEIEQWLGERLNEAAKTIPPLHPFEFSTGSDEQEPVKLFLENNKFPCYDDELTELSPHCVEFGIPYGVHYTSWWNTGAQVQIEYRMCGFNVSFDFNAIYQCNDGENIPSWSAGITNVEDGDEGQVEAWFRAAKLLAAKAA